MKNNKAFLNIINSCKNKIKTPKQTIVEDNTVFVQKPDINKSAHDSKLTPLKRKDESLQLLTFISHHSTVYITKCYLTVFSILHEIKNAHLLWINKNICLKKRRGRSESDNSKCGSHSQISKIKLNFCLFYY